MSDCTADLDGDGRVGFADLTRLLATFDDSDTATFADIEALLDAWGNCW